ncbi:hypothetical protein QT973_26240 [Microcoleus sp. Z1_A1]
MSDRSRFFEGSGCVSEARPYGGYANEEDRPWSITDLRAEGLSRCCTWML